MVLFFIVRLIQQLAKKRTTRKYHKNRGAKDHFVFLLNNISYYNVLYIITFKQVVNKCNLYYFFFAYSFHLFHHGSQSGALSTLCASNT